MSGPIICVAGARPNFVKIKPVIDALEMREVETIFVHTGQHYDANMSDVFLEELGLRQPDRRLQSGSGTHATQTAAVMVAFEPIVRETRPRAVVVVGDVNSTMACALVGAKMGSPVAHVEAGLRSRDWSMPEEVNRVVTDRVSDVLFAPSADAVDNLLQEGFPANRVHLVGNVMIDSLLANLDRARSRPTLRELRLEDEDYLLVTLHRPATVDNPETLQRTLEAIASVDQSTQVVFPAHPRTSNNLAGLDVPVNLRVVEPLGYLDFICLEASARLVFTDSGGVQEETTFLGVPCLTVRANTERPITVTEGTNRLVGQSPQAIVSAGREILRGEIPPRRPAFWDGHAAERIATVLTSSLSLNLGHPAAREEAT